MKRKRSAYYHSISDLSKDLMEILPVLLGDLFAERVRFDKSMTTELALLMNEFLFESTRARPIFIADMLDKKVAAVLKKHLRDEKTTLKNDSLLGDQKPIQSFSCRINLAYRVGLIDEDLRNHLKLINKVRVKFAHNWMAWDFDTEAVKYLGNLGFFKTATSSDEELVAMHKRLLARGCTISKSELAFLFCAVYLYISLVAAEQITRPIPKIDIYRKENGKT